MDWSSPSGRRNCLQIGMSPRTTEHLPDKEGFSDSALVARVPNGLSSRVQGFPFRNAIWGRVLGTGQRSRGVYARLSPWSRPRFGA
jgi:hypothetical protein